MFKKKKKQVKFSNEFKLNSGGEGGFTLRITESRADIETLPKDWRVMFAAGTYEYALIVYLAQKSEFASLYNCAVALYVSKTVFREASMIGAIFKAAEKANKTIAKRLEAQKPDQSDEEILSEEKALHEKTPEAVEELEKIRRKKDE